MSLPLRIVRCLAALLGAAGLLGLYVDFFAARGAVVDFFSYFTNLSNAGYVLVCLVLAFGSRSLVASGWFRAARGSITLAMALTALGYAILLPDTMSLFRNPWINYVIHGVMPVVAVLDWLFFPPDAPRLRLRDALWQWLVYPAAYAVVTFVRGAVTGWYPYPFVDPSNGGLGQVAVTTLIIALVLVSLTALAVLYQRWRCGLRARQPVST